MELKEHRNFSLLRIEELSNRVSQIQGLKDNNLCIYSTGSYGRLEASKNSDIDLFLIDTGKHQVSNLEKTLINAEIIKICRNLGLPEFSKDGLYLNALWLKDMKKNLGSPSDDYFNFFTARMLLLLESKGIYNNELYNKCLTEIINCYYVDFHDHTAHFQPIFLTNDIIRFWKSLCLNYEHRRIRKQEDNENSDEEKLVAHTKNLKLKFSRKLTCFSFILMLLARKGTIDQNDVKEIALLTPTERLQSLKKINLNVSDKIQKALNSYQWFIDKTQVPSHEMLNWISDKEERNIAFEKSRQFGEELFDILEAVDKQCILSKLLI